MNIDMLAIAIEPLFPLFFALLSILAGALFALMASRTASNALRDEAENLRRLLKLTLRALEANDLANVAYDEKGEPVEIHLVTKKVSAGDRSPDFLDSLQELAPRLGARAPTRRH